MEKAEKKDVKQHDSSSRKWLLTINNPADKGYSHDALMDILDGIKGVTYWCMCDEIGGKTKTYHTHIYIYRKNPIRFSRLQKLFPQVDLRMCKGTAKENRDYIRKEGKYKDTEKAETNLKDTFAEFGELPDEKQGQRNDLITLYELIRDGKSDYEILEENPYYMDRLNTIDKVREIQRYAEYSNKRRTDIQVEYWTGASGAGKTRKIMDTYGDSNVYRVTDYRHPWDMYRGQDIVIFEEFYGERFELPDMLNWLDIYPIDLPCRYNNKTACYTKVFLTSNKPLEEQYKSWQREEPESWKAFLRRIHCIKVFDENGYIKDYNNLDELKNAFVNIPSGASVPWEVSIKSYTECIGYISLGDCKFCKYSLSGYTNCPYDRRKSNE